MLGHNYVCGLKNVYDVLWDFAYQRIEWVVIVPMESHSHVAELNNFNYKMHQIQFLRIALRGKRKSLRSSLSDTSPKIF